MITESIQNPDRVGSYCHSASVVEFKNSLFCAWYAYADKEYENGVICFASFNEKDQCWHKPVSLFETVITKSCGNPVLFEDKKNQKLFMFFVVLNNHYWTSSKIFKSEYIESDNSWGAPIELDLPEGIMIRHRPIQMKSGEILIPAYDEKTNKSLIYKASPASFKNWELYSDVAGELIQGDLIQFSDEQLQLFLRPTDSSNRFIHRAVSPDLAKTFTSIIKTDLNCPLSGLASIKLKNGNILVCHNDTEEFKRSPLSISMAMKDEIKFKKILDIDQSNIEVSYPSMVEREDNSIALLYTYNRRAIKSVYLDKNTRRNYDI